MITARRALEYIGVDIFDVAGLPPGAYEELWNTFPDRGFTIRPETMKKKIEERAATLIDKYAKGQILYATVDFFDFSLTKYRRSHVTETELLPDIQTDSAVGYDGDGELTIDGIPGVRFVASRLMDVEDSAGSSGLSQTTNLQDVNNFFAWYLSLAANYAKEFDGMFMAHDYVGCCD